MRGAVSEAQTAPAVSVFVFYRCKQLFGQSKIDCIRVALRHTVRTQARVRPKPTPTCSAVNAELHGSRISQHNNTAGMWARGRAVQTLRYLTHCNTHQRTEYTMSEGTVNTLMALTYGTPSFREPRPLAPHSQSHHTRMGSSQLMPRRVGRQPMPARARELSPSSSTSTPMLPLLLRSARSFF